MGNLSCHFFPGPFTLGLCDIFSGTFKFSGHSIEGLSKFSNFIFALNIDYRFQLTFCDTFSRSNKLLDRSGNTYRDPGAYKQKNYT